ncbi:uncharacterized protein LOC106874739 isoform X2 [Octopus bimaculoides]|uniref:Uncharacterized protein n=1 Tax=Octopus bimaculoides TaxID=37653 RepID=A0A0L8GU99_OCTBM|nr:uncharacterized protein LOC106874739 isoform X2 [Octopus bimaculoides]XP_014778061.1 uncharacterized protein LOC106874739 isoform X2 [Octopus bimaculoides]XP_052830400.1 uncharacterized protein LOC106874739 isoform X2 [Octopus bimaculoides]|eukprot:XP_014778060.1 PREDICTED: uncharacterized protein LOC106874739 [Octopus bimaculoides]
MEYFQCWYLVIVHISLWSCWNAHWPRLQEETARKIEEQRQYYKALNEIFQVHSCEPKLLCPETLQYYTGSRADNCRFYYEYELCAVKKRWICAQKYLEEYKTYNCAPTASPQPKYHSSACFTSPYSILPILILPILV